MKIFAAIILLAAAPLLPDDNTKIWNYIYENNFKDALTTVENSLARDTENINLLSLREVCQNGLQNSKDADLTRKKILGIWNKKHKESFLSENYPINLATWIRIVEVKPSSLLIGSEYFTPYPVNPEKVGYFYHKFTVYNRYTQEPAKFYKLEKSKTTSGRYKLFEIDSDGKTTEVADYGQTLPDIRKEANTILKKLNLI